MKSENERLEERLRHAELQVSRVIFLFFTFSPVGMSVHIGITGVYNILILLTFINFY